MIGYTLSNNVTAGLGLSYSTSNRSSTYKRELNENLTSKFKNESIGVIPFIRAYKAVGSRLGLYLQGEVNYSKYWSENSSSDSLDSTNNGEVLFVGLRPGITFFIARKFALEASLGSLGYSKQKRETEESELYSESDSFIFSLNSSDLLFGLAY
ncbi:hypothetical protein [uncultured Maribacter sp.]|uniref:hypothetical protein n=1 Tax=uncultured Maribacter sp. TaxID=431308 RepID=UPI00260C8C36|nr:hypothetical protein [uncultured Maribacter sp.]